MAVTTTTTLSNTMQSYYSKKLLAHAVQLLRLNEFAQQAELPKNLGTKTIRFFRPAVGASSNVAALTEGTPISAFRDVTYTPLDITLAQYGEAAKITDVVTMVGLFDALKQSIATMGEDCALHADDTTRNAICHPTTGLTKRYAQGLTTFNLTVAATAANAKFVSLDLLDAATRLKINRAPTIDGRYVCVAPPQVTRDLMRDTDWLDSAKYSDTAKLYKGEVGMLHGVRVVEATNPFIEASTADTEGTYSGAGGIYSTVVTGMGAYGVPKLAGTASPWKPSVMICDKPDKSDPANQFITAAWKNFWAAAVLNANFGIIIRSKTLFAG